MRYIYNMEHWISLFSVYVKISNFGYIQISLYCDIIDQNIKFSTFKISCFLDVSKHRYFSIFHNIELPMYQNIGIFYT